MEALYDGCPSRGRYADHLRSLNRRTARKAERDNPPSGKFVRVNGVRLHYVERGHGEPLVRNDESRDPSGIGFSFGRIHILALAAARKSGFSTG